MGRLLFAFILLLFSKGFCQAGKPLIYKNGNVKIELITQDKKGVLKKDGETAIVIRTENLDPQMMSLSGQGLLPSKEKPTKKNELFLKINAATASLTNNFYQLSFSYKKNGKFFAGKFKIPVS